MSNYTNVLILLLRMRQACSHPALVTTKISTSDDLELVPDTKEDGARSGEAMPDGTLDDLDDLIGSLGGLTVKDRPTCPLCSNKVGPKPNPPVEGAKPSGYCAECDAKYAAFGDLQFSTKVLRCLSILDQIRAESRAPSAAAPPALAPVLGSGGEAKPLGGGGEARAHKTIIFSQFTSFFDILQPFLRKAGVRFVRLDGSMNTKQRAEALERIKRDDDKYTAILVSIKAGSVGLNLTCCSRVILMDLWWNPAIEAQAFDRAHRFGQKRDVKIFKITIDGTIEDRILTLQQEKAALAAAALDGGDLTKGNKLSMKDILSLFKRDATHSDDDAPVRARAGVAGPGPATGAGASAVRAGAAAPVRSKASRKGGTSLFDSDNSEAEEKNEESEDGTDSGSEADSVDSDSD